MAQYPMTWTDDVVQHRFGGDGGGSPAAGAGPQSSVAGAGPSGLASRPLRAHAGAWGHRNGTYDRTLTTPVGPLTLRVPRLRVKS